MASISRLQKSVTRLCKNALRIRFPCLTGGKVTAPAQGCARYRSQGRLSSWFVRLCVKSGQFVTSGHLVGALARAERRVQVDPEQQLELVVNIKRMVPYARGPS